MGTLYLSIELLFDLIAFSMGIYLICRAHDNRPRFYWGIIAVAIGGMFMWENITWLLIVTDTPTFEYTDLLNIEKMLKWYALASIVSLFPIASLSPGYLNYTRIFCFMLPPIIIITVGLCYLGFNGHITPLGSLADVEANISRLDVRLRLAIFFLSIFIPALLLVYPLLNTRTYRRFNRNMYLFLAFLFLFICIYILFTLCINEFVFNLFGITALVFTILFSLQYMYRENPFSDHMVMVSCSTSDSLHSIALPQPLPLFVSIDSYLRCHHPYTDPNYTLQQLADSQEVKPFIVSKAIKSGGFTGFREYINCLRLEYFKRLAAEENNLSIKELMFRSGYTSRSTFYRNFAARYGISPTKYLENQ